MFSDKQLIRRLKGRVKKYFLERAIREFSELERDLREEEIREAIWTDETLIYIEEGKIFFKYTPIKTRITEEMREVIRAHRAQGPKAAYLQKSCPSGPKLRSPISGKEFTGTCISLELHQVERFKKYLNLNKFTNKTSWYY